MCRTCVIVPLLAKSPYIDRARIFWQLIFTEKQLCVGERGEEFLHEVLSYYNVLCFIVCSKVISNGQRGL